MEAEHLQYIGRTKNYALVFGFNADDQDVNAYDSFRIDGSYKQDFYKTFINFQNSGSNRFTMGIGTAVENVYYRPKIHAITEAKGNLRLLRSYLYVKYNSLNQVFYPTRGIRFNGSFDYVFNQKPDLDFFKNGVQIGSPDFGNYSRMVCDASFYAPLGPNFTMSSEAQVGINFTGKPNTLNNFLIGGIDGNFRNQVRFAGLPEASVNAPSVAELQLGLRYTLANNMYVIGRANALFKDFATTKNSTSAGTWLTGYALTFAYKTPIGPLELSAMYCDQSKKLQSYVLFGIPF